MYKNESIFFHEKSESKQRNLYKAGDCGISENSKIKSSAYNLVKETFGGTEVVLKKGNLFNVIY